MTTLRGVEHDAIVLAGGRGSRLGGIDKPALVLDGRTLAERAIRALPGARAIAFVSHGEVPRTAQRDPRVRAAREEPRWAGPVAAIAAGLETLGDASRPFTVVIASDLVAAAPAVAALLQHAPEGVDGIIATDPQGVRQPLLAVYRTTALTAVARAVIERTVPHPRGPSMRAVVERLAVRELPLPSSWCADVDTPDDAARYGIALPVEEVRRDRVA